MSVNNGHPSHFALFSRFVGNSNVAQCGHDVSEQTAAAVVKAHVRIGWIDCTRHIQQNH